MKAKKVSVILMAAAILAGTLSMAGCGGTGGSGSSGDEALFIPMPMTRLWKL